MRCAAFECAYTVHGTTYNPFVTLLLLEIPLFQPNLTAQLPPLPEPLLLHPSRDLNQLIKIPITLPNELSLSSTLLDHLIGGKVALCDDLAVYRDFRASDWVQEGVDEPHENR